MQCYKHTSGCPGAYGSNCYPNAVWSGSTYSGSTYYDGYLNNGSFQGPHSGNNSAAVSVRCVLDLKRRNGYRQLCDGNSGSYGALRCNYHETACKGAPSDDCWPNIVWSGTLNSSTIYYGHYLNSGSFNASNWSYTNAYSVRCVLDLACKLQLCDSSSGRGALQCDQHSSGCPGAGNNCLPYHVWTGTPSSSGYYCRYLSNNGEFSASCTNDSASAKSVRCVLDLNIVTTNADICDLNSGYGALQCNPNYGGCPGSYNDNCYPNALWSGTASGSLYYIGNLNNGTFYARRPDEERITTITHGVRCVLDLACKLQLCDRYEGYGALQCQNRSGCTGSTGNCVPYYMWTGTGSGTSYYRGGLNNGSVAINSVNYGYAFSVRCVLDLKFKP